MKLLVTGAGGFIGRVLTYSLAEQGHEVLAFDNNTRGNLDMLHGHERIKLVTGDVLDFEGLCEITCGVEAIYHLAYINGTKYFYTIPDKILEIGIIGTHNILKACLKNKVPHFFLASSSEVYQKADHIPTTEEVEMKIPDVTNPRFSYGGGKIASELLTINYLRNSDTRWVIFRPHNVYGPCMGYEHVIPELVKKIVEAHHSNMTTEEITITIQGNGEETRSFIFVEDAAQAIIMSTLGTNKNDIYHIGTMEEITIKDLIAKLSDVCGYTIKVLTSERLLGSTPRRCPDTLKLQQLGFKPKTSLIDGLKKTVSWYWEDYQSKKE